MKIEDLKREIKADWDFHGAWRDEARDNYDFMMGDQWEEEARIEMEEDNRVPLVFNRVSPIIHAIAGTEINNRTEVRYIPRTIGDAKVNEALTAGAEWFRDTAQAEEEDSQSFMDSLICGIGSTETSLDFEVDSEGEPTITRLDPITTFWDRAAHRKCLKDAQRVGVVLFLPRAEAEARFPSANAKDLNASWLGAEATEGGQVHHNKSGDQYAGSDKGEMDDPNPDTVCIVQVQWCEREKSVEYADPMTGERKEMAKDKFDRLSKLAPNMNIPNRQTTKKVWRQAFIGERLLGEITYPCKDASTIKFITGNYNRKKKRWFGIMEVMKSPQMFANKSLSQILRIIDTNAKGGVMIESDAVSDISKFEESWAASDSVSLLKPGGLNKVREKGMPDFPAAIMQLMDFSISSIRDVSGVNLEILGMREANQPGVLEYQRRQSAMTTLAGAFDALRQYRKEQGAVVLYFLVKHIAPTGRLVRLIKDGEPTYEPLSIDGDQVKYDIIVDDAPTAPNQKEQTWQFIQQLMPMLQNAGLSMDLWMDIFEHSPLPRSLVEKMRAEAEKAGKAPPDPMQEMMAQLAIKKEESEIAENMSNAQLDAARTAEIQREAQLAGPRLQIEAARAIPQQFGASLTGA
jgi:hypothetical protein